MWLLLGQRFPKNWTTFNSIKWPHWLATAKLPRYLHINEFLSQNFSVRLRKSTYDPFLLLMHEALRQICLPCNKLARSYSTLWIFVPSKRTSLPFQVRRTLLYRSFSFESSFAVSNDAIDLSIKWHCVSWHYAKDQHSKLFVNGI